MCDWPDMSRERGQYPRELQNDGWTMAGRVRVFPLTLWLMAFEWAYMWAAFAVARATAAEQV